VFPEPLSRSRLLLRRWFWRGALAGTLTGATIGMRKHLESVVPGEEEPSVQRLLVLAGPAPDDQIELAPFQFGTARSKLQCCVLASKRPLSLLDGKPVDLGSLFEGDAREKVMRFVPRRVSDEDSSRGLANRLLHPLMPTKALRAAVAGASEPALASHGISPRARSALVAGRFDEFFRRRTIKLSAWIDAYFRRQAEWRSSDRPSIASLRVEED